MSEEFDENQLLSLNDLLEVSIRLITKSKTKQNSIFYKLIQIFRPSQMSR